MLAHAVVVGDLGRLLRRREVVTRVVVQSVEGGVADLHALGVEELLFLDVVALAQLERVDLHLARQGIHRHFDGVGRLGATGTAIGVGRRHVGEHRRASEVVGLRQVVDTRIEERTQNRHARRYQLQVGTHVADEAHANGSEFAVRVGSQLDVLNLAATVDGRLRVLGALFHPAHGCTVLAGEGDTQQFFGIHVELRAEAAAHRRRHDAHLMFGDAKGDRRHHLQDVRHLRGGIQRDVATEWLRHGGNRARLHRHRQQTLLHVALAHRECGVLERFVNRAFFGFHLERPGVRLVRADRFVNDRLVAQRVFEIDHCAQWFVHHVNRIECIARRRLARGEHRSDTVTDVARLVDRQRKVRRVLHVGGHRPSARHWCRPHGVQVATGVHRHDARHRRRI